MPRTLAQVWRQVQKNTYHDPPIVYVLQFFDPTECLTGTGRPLSGIDEMVIYSQVGTITDVDTKSITVFSRWQEIGDNNILQQRERKITLHKGCIHYLDELRLHKKWIDDSEPVEDE